MPSGGQTSKVFLCKILLARMGNGFTQPLGVVALLEPWQMCLSALGTAGPASPTFAAGAAAEQGDHKLLSLLAHEAAAAGGHCYDASTPLRSSGTGEEPDSVL